MASPTSLTLRWIRRQGYTVGIVERFLAHVQRPDGGKGVRSDFLRCIDIVACKCGAGIVGIQATSAANVSSRIAKAKGIPELREWLRAGSKFWVIGWKKDEKGRYVARVEELKLDDMAELSVTTTTKPARKKPRSRWQTAMALFDAHESAEG